MKISVICVYNDENAYLNQLVKSLDQQDTEYELIAICNVDNSFCSAAAALNYGASSATGDVLVFSHQDIYFKTERELRKLAEAIGSCPTGTIVGTQGVKEPSKIYYSNLTAGKVLKNQLNQEYTEKLYPVSCVDEGLFGMKRDTWLTHPFDEDLCDNWHLYCVEACLFARKNRNSVYVWPSQIHHFSMGTISLRYMQNLKRLCKVYRKDFKYIWTTCYKVYTNPVYMEGLYLAWVFNRWVRGRLK